MTEHRQYLLPEWHPQHAVIITWPHQHSDWKDMLDTVQACYIHIAKAISESQKLLIIAYDQTHQESITQQLKSNKINLANISFSVTPTNDTWVRDYGPITVKNTDIKNNQKLIWQDFEFNAWGDKFNSQLDNLANTHLIQHPWFCDNYSLEKQDYILEGGSIELNSNGDLLTTASCVDNLNRHNSQAEQNNVFQQILGCRNIYKLHHGALSGDDTDGHIDTLARFASDHIILSVGCDNPADEHYSTINKMQKEIEQLPFENILLPMPEARFDQNNFRLPATYANFLIINHSVLVPTYNCKQDEAALDIFKHVFKNKKVIAVDCNALIYQHGSLHCSTMQIPAPTSDLTTGE